MRAGLRYHSRSRVCLPRPRRSCGLLAVDSTDAGPARGGYNHRGEVARRISTAMTAHHLPAAAVVVRCFGIMIALALAGAGAHSASAATPGEVEAALQKAKKFLYSQ